ncbi:MAG TPA: hypothetical protein VN851_19175, partial [Thermoanaerobaculia bacterium]|nr:hypothetical protein [Thermoanaerobaculia bacterium]
MEEALKELGGVAAISLMGRSETRETPRKNVRGRFAGGCVDASKRLPPAGQAGNRDFSELTQGSAQLRTYFQSEI